MSEIESRMETPVNRRLRLSFFRWRKRLLETPECGSTEMTTPYTPSPLHSPRRPTREVMVGPVGVGGDNPIRVQSMLTSDTRDTDACVGESMGLVEAGCEIVRVTAQTRK